MAEQLPRLTDEVTSFLVEAKHHGYGSEWGSENRTVLSDGRYQLEYTTGSLKYVDTWSGGNPFKGAEDLCWQVEDGVWRPFWGLTYFGESPDYIEQDEARLAVKVLRLALTNPDYRFPVRGRIGTSIEGLSYNHTQPYMFDDGLERFGFDEWVWNENGSKYYTGKVMGGIVNRSLKLESLGQTPWFQ